MQFRQVDAAGPHFLALSLAEVFRGWISLVPSLPPHKISGSTRSARESVPMIRLDSLDRNNWAMVSAIPSYRLRRRILSRDAG